jgi:hypothetical protein
MIHMSSASKKTAVQIIVSLLIGFTVGILTNIGQKYLPGDLNSIANSGSVWLIPAFFVSAWVDDFKKSIICGIEMLIVCVASYYGFEAVLNNHSFEFGGYYFYLWLGCAFIFGTVFGIGAYFYSQNKKHYQWGASLLPAVFLAEGLCEVIHLQDYKHMIPAVIGRFIIGIALYFIIYRKDFLQKNALLTFFVLTALGVGGFEILYRLT